MHNMKHEYPLTEDDSRRIRCDVCPCQATMGMYEGGPPFSYVCAVHAEVYHLTGTFYKEPAKF